MVLAAEAFTDNIANRIKSVCNAKLYNGYGPSETMYVTFTDVTQQEKINIGLPIYNTKFYILDSNMKMCPIGISGEIYISGDGVGKGYVNNKELTDEKFLDNPFGRRFKTIQDRRHRAIFT